MRALIRGLSSFPSPPHDLIALCRSSRRLRDVVQPFLFHNIEMLFTPFRRCLRFPFKRHDLVSRVKRLSIRGERFFYSDISDIISKTIYLKYLQIVYAVQDNNNRYLDSAFGRRGPPRIVLSLPRLRAFKVVHIRQAGSDHVYCQFAINKMLSNCAQLQTIIAWDTPYLEVSQILNLSLFQSYIHPDRVYGVIGAHTSPTLQHHSLSPQYLWNLY